ncbi:TPR-like protein [Gloeophyllum trabeum ATCC 11539]|uniref:TPR-like protein n=1 Tax=Gloeophyllum trabeum (strain ATCC 11539 / FP-39264 / Madison 617) TaxID=670483 RepID=S7QCZ2_GLOTA|nr:TPR-like protein [Gloeophyllum trabeum ATCC 11539]EPQ57253.1 TPR-like protein [Gloeophyllum trabeum ATCC 11539]
MMSSGNGVDWETISALKAAVRDCSSRRLTVATKWVSELLLSVPEAKRRVSGQLQDQTFETSTPPRSRGARASLSFSHHSPGPSAHNEGPSRHAALATELLHHPDAPTYQPLPEEIVAQERAWEEEEEDALIAAQSLFDAREFLRAVAILDRCRSSKARFLSLYSRFLFSEKKAARDWNGSDKKRDQQPHPINTSLRDLFLAVQNAEDPWLLFLKALFLSRMRRREETIESLLLSLSRYPWNWSAWTLLGQCISDGEELQSLLTMLPLPPTHPLVHIFQVKMSNQLESVSDNELGLCDRLLGENFFPKWTWLMIQRALVLYNLHTYPPAAAQFEKIIAADPHRIDGVDIYANILFVMHDTVKLSKLAFDYLDQEKDRPEICCLIGNHYSLRGENVRAAEYFLRATQLDSTYVSAWTLLGHEYIELKNSHAAIDAYRRAVDFDRKDHKAWFGLGQAYELLNMHTYALYYYQRSAALSPYDVRVWQAQGLCYMDLGRPREAIDCFKHATRGEHPNMMGMYEKIAKCYNELEEYGEAAAYHRRIVEASRQNDKSVEEFSKSYMFVARYHMYLGGGDLELAKEYLEMLANSHAEEVAQATEWLKKVKTMIQARSDRSIR